MTAIDECREYEAECLQAARLSLAPEVRAALISAAQYWDELAERIERFAARFGDMPGSLDEYTPVDGKGANPLW